MKKTISIIAIGLTVFSLSACGWNSGPISTTRPLPSSSSSQAVDNPSVTPSPSESSAPEESSTPEASATSNNNANERKEIANMLKDAKDLVNEGLLDDAKMLLQNLRSRNLTADEKKQVDELQAKLIKISD